MFNTCRNAWQALIDEINKICLAGWIISNRLVIDESQVHQKASKLNGLAGCV